MHECMGCKADVELELATVFYVDGGADQNRVILCGECQAGLVNFYATVDGAWPPPLVADFIAARALPSRGQ